MPRAALESVAPHYVLSSDEIGPTLVTLTSAPLDGKGRAARILIVEDESVVATNLQQSLVEMGYDVVEWVPTGEAALRLVERAHPDLVVADDGSGLPGGFDVQPATSLGLQLVGCSPSSSGVR